MQKSIVAISKMPRQHKKKSKNHNLYFKALVNETLEDLGSRIHTFRNLSSSLTEHAKTDNYDNVSIKLIDEIYQTALDEIFDALSNAGELKAGNIACEGISKSMLIKRGFIKKSKAFE